MSRHLSAQQHPAPRPADVPPVVARVPARLNAEQAEAVAHRGPALVVVAGPGSGKTRVLTYRIAGLLDAGVPPREILAVTFTNKAAREMRSRLEAMLGAATVAGMWVSTFHSACVRILRQEHVAAGLPRSFAIYDTDDANRILRGVLSERGRFSDELTAAERRKEAGVYAEAISSAKNRLGDYESVAARTGLDDLAEVAAGYAAALAEVGALDFDDLLLRVRVLLEEHPDVRAAFQERFSNILIDEYQDTNLVQLQIVRLLAGDGSGLCVVGDVDQSIYGWRGAHPEVMVAFAEDFPGAAVVVLGANYRSTPQILDVCQEVIAANPARHRPVLRTDNPAGPVPVLHEASSDRAEADWVVSRIRASSDPFSSHAVLFRTNAQTRLFEEALVGSRIPYVVIGSQRFFERAEVRDALAWLRLVSNSSDRVAFLRACSAPRRGLGDKAVSAVVAHSRACGVGIVDAARQLAVSSDQPKRVRTALGSFCAALDGVVVAARSGAGAAAEEAAFATGLADHWAKDPSGETRVENLEELVSAASSWESGGAVTADGSVVSGLTGPERLSGFLEHVALLAAADEDPDAEQVRLMTVHAAKGREFGHVYVVGLEDGLFPHSRSQGDAASVAEERRLLFVACSRAERTLALSWARERFFHGSLSLTAPSPFLREIGGTVDRTEDPVVVRQWGSRPGGGPSSFSPASSPLRRSSRKSPPWSPSRRATGQSFTVSGAGKSHSTPAPATRGVQAVKFSGPRLAASQVGPGTPVVHDAFGPGVVVEVSGSDARVRFSSGVKVLDLGCAPLRLAASHTG